jgi:hypothetical protein
MNQWSNEAINEKLQKNNRNSVCVAESLRNRTIKEAMLFSLPSCTGFDTLTVVILYRVTGWPEQLGSRFSNNIQNQTLTTCFFIPFHNLHWTGTSSLPAYLVCVFLFRHYLTLTAEWPEGYLSGGHSYSTEMCWEHSPPLRFLLNILSQNMASSVTSAMTENRVATLFVHCGVWWIGARSLCV